MNVKKTLKILYPILLTLVSLIFIFPIVWMLVSSVKPEAAIMRDLSSLKAFILPSPSMHYFDNYINVVNRIPIFKYALNSFIYTTAIIAFSLIINSMAAYAFARLDFPFKNFWFAIIVSLIIIPGEVTMLPLFSIVHKFGWVNSYKGLIIPFIADALNIFLFRQFFLGIPKEVEEAAKIDGASTFTTFFKIIIPLAKPVFATVTILTFIKHWNDFLWPVLIITDESKRTIQLAMNTLFNLQPVYYGEIMAALTLATIPVVIVFMIFQKYYVQGMAHSGSKD